MKILYLIKHSANGFEEVSFCFYANIMVFQEDSLAPNECAMHIELLKHEKSRIYLAI